MVPLNKKLRRAKRKRGYKALDSLFCCYSVYVKLGLDIFCELCFDWNLWEALIDEADKR